MITFADLKTISAMLGRSGITITANTYVHVMPSTKRATAEAMGNRLSGPEISIQPEL